MSLPPRSYGIRYRFNWKNWVTPAIKTIVLIATGVFLVQTLLGLFAPDYYVKMELFLGLVPALVTHYFFVWQLVTYLFLHGGVFHLLFNVLFLWMFGVDLERTWGKRRFFTYFFLTGAGAGLINVLVKTLLPSNWVGRADIPTIGFSGAVYGVLLAAAILFPDRQVWLIPFPVQIPMRIYVLAAGAIEFFFTLGAGGDNVSHVTHLGGMLVGYLYLRRGLFLFGVRNRFSDWQRRRLRRKFEVYSRKHRDEPPSRPDQWVN